MINTLAMAQTNLDSKFKQCYVSTVPLAVRQGFSAIKDPKFMVIMEKDVISNMTKAVPFKPIAGLDSATNLIIYQESVKTIKPIADCMRALGERGR